MRLHFVAPPGFGGHLKALTSQTVGRDYPYWLPGRYNWVALSWLILRQYIEGCTIGLDPVPGVINFAHSMVWRELGQRVGEYRVSARADYRRLFDVDFEILQNPAVPLSDNQAYLPYWPVPGIIPRDSHRADVATIAYAGFMGARNLDSAIRTRFEAECAALGLKFTVVPPERWHDMSQIDILIAIRDFSRRSFPEKPPSKLFNAWLANIPLIGGWDSAFSAVGSPGKDYVRVETIEQLMAEVAGLRNDRRKYDEIVAAGRLRAEDVTQEKVAGDWLRLFRGRVTQHYQRWLESGGTDFINLASGLDRGKNMLSSAKKSVVRLLRER